MRNCILSKMSVFLTTIIMSVTVASTAISTTFTNHLYNSSEVGVVRVMDMDNDGDSDVVSLSISGTLTVYRNTLGNLEVTYTTAGGGSSYDNDVELSDINGDERTDIVVSDPASHSVKFYKNNGSLSFSVAQTVSVCDAATDVSDIGIGDYDHDGYRDLFVLCFGTEGNRVAFYNRPNPSSSPFGYVLDTGAQLDLDFIANRFQVANLNMDVHNPDDLLIGGWEGYLYQFMCNGDGTYTKVAAFPTDGRMEGISVGDLDNDGDRDVIAAEYNSGKVLIFKNDGTGEISSSQSVWVGSNALDVAIANIDGIGEQEIVVIRNANNSRAINIFTRQSNGNYRATTPLGFGSNGFIPFSLAMGDLNGDSKTDIVVSSPDIDQLLLMTQN